MYKLDLGPAIAMSPDCYKNFISYYRTRLGSPVNKHAVNALLAESNANAVLRRSRLKATRTVFNGTTMKTEQTTRGDWYLDFKTKRDYISFMLTWSDVE
jgi:hypothetical protein